jgi:hypothetical protein
MEISVNDLGAPRGPKIIPYLVPGGRPRAGGPPNLEAVISFSLAKQLRSAGLGWKPASGDVFHIPDRNLDHRVFTISDLSTDVTTLADGIGAITFNGAVEWSQDYILTQDVVWLPSEEQMRHRLGEWFVALTRTDIGYRCDIATHDGPLGFEAPTAADAYGWALIHLLDATRRESVM